MSVNKNKVSFGGGTNDLKLVVIVAHLCKYI